MMKQNEHLEFVGIEALKEKHLWQLQQFQHWAEQANWSRFHEAHYDWWMFPYDGRNSYQYAYTIFEYEMETLKQDKGFIDNYLEGVRLLMLSWGWDLKNEVFIENPF